MMKGLANRYQTSYDSKDGGNSKSVLDLKGVDVSYYKPEEGRNRINIIPYRVSSKNHPLIKKRLLEVGDYDYGLDIWIHKNIGPSQSSVVCLQRNYGKPCPICEQEAKFREEGKKKEANALKASRRVFYNVEDLRNPNEIKLFDVSHYLFEKELIEEARSDDGGFIPFADDKKGRVVKFKMQKVNKGGIKFNEFKSFGFEKREEPVSSELLDSALPLDKLLTVYDYDELEKLLFGDDDDDDVKRDSFDEEDDDDDEEEKLPSKKSHKRAFADDDDEDDDDDSSDDSDDDDTDEDDDDIPF